MRKLKLFLLSIFIIGFFSNVCLAQNIEFNQLSKMEQIEKIRSLLLDAIIENDLIKIESLYYSLLDFNNSNYISVYPGEEWLISYLLLDYEKVLNGIKTYNLGFENTLYTKVHPDEDFIFQKLKEQISSQLLLIKNQIRTSEFNSEQKEFLELNLDYLLTEVNYLNDNQTELNGLANNFLSRYPKSEYENYIREYVRYEMKVSKWGLGFEFFSGYGSFTNDLADKFKDNIPIGVAFDISYQNIVLYLRDYIGFSRTVDSISFGSGTWRKNAQVRVFLPEASIGYNLIDNDLIKMAPFAGISSTHVSPTDHDREKYPEYDDVGLNFTTTFTYGVNLDLKIGSGSGLIVGGPEKSYWFIRLRYAYNQPQYSKKYNGFNGDFHYITIGFGGFGSKLKRDY